MHWFDIVIIVILVASVLDGWKKGFVKQVLSLVGLILSFYLSIRIQPMLYVWLEHPIVQNPFVRTAMLMITTFIFLGLFRQLTRRFSFLINMALGVFNRGLGAIVSAIMSLVFIGVVGGFMEQIGIISDGASSSEPMSITEERTLDRHKEPIIYLNELKIYPEVKQWSQKLTDYLLAQYDIQKAKLIEQLKEEGLLKDAILEHKEWEWIFEK